MKKRYLPPARPTWVNLRGEAVDPFASKRGSAAITPAPAIVALPVPVLSESELATVYDALALAGCARGKTWVQQFLRLLDQQTDRGTQFTAAEVAAGLHRLRDDGRILLTEHRGYEVPAAQRALEWPRLLAADHAAQAWRAWAAAGSQHLGRDDLPPRPNIAHPDEAGALARLVLRAAPTSALWNAWSGAVLGPAASATALVHALTEPWIEGLWAAQHVELQAAMLNAFQGVYAVQAPVWQALMPWLAQKLASEPAALPPPVRLMLAEARLHAGDATGTRQAIADLGGAGAALIEAAQLAQAGRWNEASKAFAEAIKAAQKEQGKRRGFAGWPLMQWHVLALMAQPDASAWSLAHKFCVAESGSRKPVPTGGWGLWAHALALRLGETTPERGVFDWPKEEWRQPRANEAANRLLLAAWISHTPSGWTERAVAEVLQGLLELGMPWKADLVRQACERLQISAPARADGQAPAWPVSFYGAPREAWREALAVIEALDGACGQKASPVAPPALSWQITLDPAGRVAGVQVLERVMGVRGPGKAKPVPLSRLKLHTRLTERDAAVVRCIVQQAWSSSLVLDVVPAVLALVGHPAVSFADAPQQCVELSEALPVLEVRRQRLADEGGEAFVFHLADNIVPAGEPDLLLRDMATSNHAKEVERRNALIVVRDGADRARLLRIGPAQRRVAELVAKRWAVPVSAQAELAAALRVLAGHFQLHSDAEAGQEVASQARLRAQLSPQGDALQLRVVVQPFGEFGPVLVPGSGRERLITLLDGLSMATRRDLVAESAHLQALLEAVPMLADAATSDAQWLIDDPEQALALVEVLPRVEAVRTIDWPRGKPVRVHAPPATAMRISVVSGADWFALDGELRVDEQRVLGLDRLLSLMDGSRGRFVALGEGEYLALTEALRRQLDELRAMAVADRAGLLVPAAAAGWLAETLDGVSLTVDKPWLQRQARLDEAAALQPVLPGTLQAQLRPYQAEGFAWMARLAHAGLGACLADDMGLGKTVQTLALLLHRAALGPALVIAPTSVCGNWMAEAARFAPSLELREYIGADRAARLEGLAPGHIVVVSYALAQIDVEAFAAHDWATLVLDEAQALKNAATKRAKSVASLRADFRLALSGTPVENRLADLWSIMNILNPGLLGNQTRFGERFASIIERGQDERARRRLHRLVAPFLLRRTKAQVLADLPPRTEIVHRIEPGAEERAFLEALRRRAVEQVSAADGDGSKAAFHVLAQLTKLRRAACDPRLVAPELGIVGAKIAEFEQLVSELVAGRHKALVFSQFTDFLALLAQRLDSAGVSYQVLDGSTPAAERTKRVAAFQRGEGDLFLISLKAGGFGLNLTAADYVIIVDPWWNPAAEDQAMGRAHRIGQQRPVTVYRLVTAGSIEERIVALHGHKRQLADGILQEQDQAVTVDAAALRALLSDAAAL